MKEKSMSRTRILKRCPKCGKKVLSEEINDIRKLTYCPDKNGCGWEEIVKFRRRVSYIENFDEE